MMLYVSIMFHENILKGFQVLERTQNDHCRISNGNNYKPVLTRVTVLCSTSRLLMLYISMKFHDDILNGV